MGLRNLYLRIYLTVVAVLLVFALVAGGVTRLYTENERGRIETELHERAAVWGSLIEASLVPATAPEEAQRDSLLDWADKLKLPLALDRSDGQRLATSRRFERLVHEGQDLSTTATRVVLKDGRVLWIGRPNFRDAGLPFLDRKVGRKPHRDRVPEGHEEMGPASASGGEGADIDPGPPPPGLDLGDRPPRRHLDREGFGRPGGPWLEILDRFGGPLVVGVGVLFVAVAAGSYPVIRRLTRRLEVLKQGVETFGSGQLGHRVAVDGRDEVAALAGAFNHAAQRVEDLVTSHKSLLANASHELRSPLARLKMAVEMLEISAPERRDALREEIRRDIRELDALVDEVLLASRLDASSELSLVPVELTAVVAEEASRVGASLEVAPEVASLTVQANERLVRRAVRNLLENARRYGGPHVEAHVQFAGEGALEVRICDRGPGVPADQRERIFEPFYRMPGHAERAGGVGLGLALVRQIAQRHGGDVRCEGRMGGGSCFVIRLPRGAQGG